MSSLIEVGKIRRRTSWNHQGDDTKEMKHPRETNFRMQFLDEKAIPEIQNLQAQVARCLPDPKIFHLQSEEDLGHNFQLERSVIGVLVEDRLAAYSIIRLPGEAADNLGRDLNLPPEELGSIAHLQAIAVHPAYRGSGLQRRMEMAHLKVIEDLGIKHVCCTISPQNPVSLCNTLECGFLIKGLRLKFEGWWRFILHRSRPCETIMDHEEISINGSDIAGQVDLLRQGFVGFKMAFVPGGFDVFYRRVH